MDIIVYYPATENGKADLSERTANVAAFMLV